MHEWQALGARYGAARNEETGLTPREVEVLEHVVVGLTNRQIASSLAISDRTVERHLSNIFAKLEVSSRTEAAAVAFARGLVAPPGSRR